MSKPPDLSKGVEKFFEFHEMEPKKTGRFSPNFRIPKNIGCAGEALWIYYKSTKWGGKSHNYKHQHSYGVKLYRPDGNVKISEVPYSARDARTFVRLGHCLGFEYKDIDGEIIEAVTRKPYPDLYCTPDGSVLLIIQGKSKLEAMIWGGNLDVKAQGIVG